MSLNICLAKDFDIYQSADLRVTRFVPRGTVWVQDSFTDLSPKILVISYFEWRAVITYVGFAELDGLPTSDWLVRTLVHPLGERSVSDVVEALRSAATLSFKRLTIPDYPRMHTFTMGVLGNPSRVVMISNFESLHGPPRKTAATEFFVSEDRLRSKARPIVRVAGVPAAVTKDDKNSLLRAIRSESDALYGDHTSAPLSEQSGGSEIIFYITFSTLPISVSKLP